LKHGDKFDAEMEKELFPTERHHRDQAVILITSLDKALSDHLLQADPKNSKHSHRFSTSGEFDVLSTSKISRLWFLHQLAFSKLLHLLWNHPNKVTSFLSEIFAVA